MFIYNIYSFFKKIYKITKRTKEGCKLFINNSCNKKYFDVKS